MMRKLIVLTAPILCLSLSFQTLAFQTPAERNREQAVTTAKTELRQFMGMFPYAATRACVNMATAKRGFFDLSSLGIMMLPGALIFDTLMIPVGIIGVPVLEGKVIFEQLKGRFESCGDKEKLSKELELLRSSLHQRHEAAEKLIGSRFINSEDVLAFSLGFTVIHSLNYYEGLVLVNEKKIVEKDIEVFPITAEQAFHSLMFAKKELLRLPQNLQNEEAFMKALVDRMTFENANDADRKLDHPFDTLDSVIHYLRDAAKNINKTVEALNE